MTPKMDVFYAYYGLSSFLKRRFSLFASALIRAKSFWNGLERLERLDRIGTFGMEQI